MRFRTCTVSDIIELKYGKGLSESKRIEGDFPVYGSGGIVGTHKEALVKGPGIIVGRKGTAGSVYYEANDFFPIDTVYYVVSKLETDSFRFIYYLLKTLPLSSLNSDAAVPGLNREAALRVNIKIPELSDIRKRIASILSAYDDLIENNLRRIKLLEESARQLYKEWFIRLRFPGYEHTNIVNGVPERWEKKKLDTIAVVNRNTISSSFEGLIKYIDISSVTSGSINQTSEYDFRDAPSRARRVVRHGDIIWSCVRPNRRSHSIIWKPEENLIASTGFAVVSPTIVPTSFLYYSTTTDAFVGYLENRARGAAYPAVVAKDFEDADIMVPTRNLLSIFDDTVRPMIDQVQNLRIQNQKLRQALELLLPKLMGGEIEV